MSVIAGSWHFDGRPQAAADCQKMLEAQRHYATGTPATWDGGFIGLARTLSPLLPEDQFDRQPLADPGSRFRLIADCRLDNRDELTGALSLPPATARTHADSDLLLLAWQRWESAAVDRLTGDFAVAVWDAASRSLTLFRDPLGQRPLFYHASSSAFAFASMPSGLHALERVPYGIDELRILEGLLPLVTPTRRGWFRDIHQLLPGELLTIKPGDLRFHRYWRPEEIAYRKATRQDHAAALREALDRAVRAQLRGTGNIATQLSGGLDSSAVTTSAAHHITGSERRLIAFTAAPYPGFAGAGPANRTLDESPLAAECLKPFPHIEHVIIRPSLDTPLLHPQKPYPLLFGRPASDLCNLTWTELLFATAAEKGAQLLLTGLPGNATISYNGLDAIEALVKRGHLLRAAKESNALVRQGVLTRKYSLWRMAKSLLPLSMELQLERLLLSRKPQRITHGAAHPERIREHRLEQRMADQFRHMERRKEPVRLSILEFLHEIGPIHKGMFAAWGIDIRNPTADRRLIELCLSIPPEQFLEDGQPAAIYRRAFASRLPAAVLDSRKRGLQGADWHERLERARPALQQQLAIFKASPTASSLMDLNRLQTLLDNWPATGWDRPEIAGPYRGALLHAITMGQFILSVEAGKKT